MACGSSKWVPRAQVDDDASTTGLIARTHQSLATPDTPIRAVGTNQRP